MSDEINSGQTPTQSQQSSQAQPPSSQSAPQGSTGDATNYQRMADTAARQVGEAADAFRRGEFMRDATVDPEADQDDRLVAMLAYVVPVLLPIIVLLSESSKKRSFQHYHAVQSLGLTIGMTLLSIALALGTAILQIVPIIGWLVGVLMFCLSPILFLMGIVAIFYYGYQAYQGKRFTIPAVTSYLHDQGWL